eukprot:3093807-Pyramimonas_sp.AAC.1
MVATGFVHTVQTVHTGQRRTCGHAVQATGSTAKKAFDFSSTVDSRRLSTLVYHSAHVISNIPSNIRRIFPADRLPLASRQSTPGLDAVLVFLQEGWSELAIGFVGVARSE